MPFSISDSQRLILLLEVGGMKGIEKLLPASTCSCSLARSWSDPHLTYSIKLCCGVCDSCPKSFSFTPSERDLDIECPYCDEGERPNVGKLRILRRGEEAVKPGELKSFLEVQLTGDFVLGVGGRDQSSTLVDLPAAVGDDMHPLVEKPGGRYEVASLAPEDFSIAKIDCSWSKAEWNYEPTYDLLGLPAHGDSYDSVKHHWPPGIPEKRDKEEGTGEEGSGEEEED